MAEHLVEHAPHHDGTRVYADLRPYDHGSFVAELEVRSGNVENDGLVMNTALVRLTLDQLAALAQRADEIGRAAIERSKPWQST